MGSLETNGYYNPIYGASTYLPKRAFRSLLVGLCEIGAELPSHEWAPKHVRSPRALRLHNRAIVGTLIQAAGPIMKDPEGVVSDLVGDKERLRNAGLALTFVVGRHEAVTGGKLTDYYRYIQGYPLSLIIMLSEYRYRGNYAVLPPFVTSATMAEMVARLPEPQTAVPSIDPQFGEEERRF